MRDLITQEGPKLFDPSNLGRIDDLFREAGSDVYQRMGPILGEVWTTPDRIETTYPCPGVCVALCFVYHFLLFSPSCHVPSSRSVYLGLLSRFKRFLCRAHLVTVLIVLVSMHCAKRPPLPNASETSVKVSPTG